MNIRINTDRILLEDFQRAALFYSKKLRNSDLLGKTESISLKELIVNVHSVNQTCLDCTMFYRANSAKELITPCLIAALEKSLKKHAVDVTFSTDINVSTQFIITTAPEQNLSDLLYDPDEINNIDDNVLDLDLKNKLIHKHIWGSHE